MRKKIDLVAHTIPHYAQKYETVGNYGENTFGRWVEISNMDNVDYEFLVLIHELIEQHLCMRDGVKEKDITAFDIAFEKNRLKGDNKEPGDSKAAPYYGQHQFATKIERLIAKKMGIVWRDYDKKVNSLLQE